MYKTKNRDFEPTYLPVGTQCPWQNDEDHRVGGIVADNWNICEHCHLCKQLVFQQGTNEQCGVMCMYRKDPPFEPLYKLGDEYWYLWTYRMPQKKKIRLVTWSPQSACWRYTFSRERNSFEECKVFPNRKTCEEFILLCQVEETMHFVEEHKKRWGSLPSGTTQLLLSGGEQE